jgi:hypothetical protein
MSEKEKEKGMSPFLFLFSFTSVGGLLVSVGGHVGVCEIKFDHDKMQ